MTATWMWVRGDWRRSLGNLVALAALLAVAGGVVLAFAAGTRRADTVLDRFLAAAQAPDIVLAAPIDGPDFDIDTFNTNVELVDEAAAIDGVESVGVQSWWALVPADEVEPGAPVSPFVVGYSALSEGSHPMMVVGGQLPGPDDDGVVVNEQAERLGLTVGAPVTLRSVAAEHFGEWAGHDAELADDGLLDGPTITTHVAAVIRTIDDLSSDDYPVIAVMPGFEALHGAAVAHCDCFVMAHTDGNHPEAMDQLTRLYAGYGMQPVTDDPVSDVVRLAIDVEVITLRIASWVAAAAALLLVGQAFGRAVARIAINHHIRRALGMTTGELVLGSVLILAPALVAGLLGAVATAALLSQVFPVGLARLAEVDPGIRIDAQTLLLDVPALLVTGLGLTTFLAWRAASSRLDHLPLPPPVITRIFIRPAPALGASFSVDPLGGGRRSRFVAATSVISVAVAVGACLTVATFARSTDHLRHTPALFGAAGNFVFDSNGETGVDDAVTTALDDPHVPSVTRRMAIDSDTIGLMEASHGGSTTAVQPAAYRSVRGDGIPALIDGRLPDSTDEVAVGLSIAHSLGSHVGDTIRLRTDDGRTLELTETGTVVDWTTDAPDRSFIVTEETLREAGCPNTGECDFAETVFAGMGDTDVSATLADAGFVRTPPPANVERLGQVGSIPWYLAAFLGALALAGIGHSLASAGRRRRNDLAIVRALGLTASSASRSFGWQAGLTTLVGAAVGVVLGIVAGRVVWGVVATQLGVLDRPVVPIASIPVVATAMIVSAVAIALVPAVRTRRLRPVELLRAE